MVTPKRYEVRWDTHARDSLKQIYRYIKRDSPQSAKKVKKAISELAKSLSTFPERHANEPYLEGEPGNYRFVPIWSYKIIYEVTESSVNILDIFHTSRNPDTIKSINKNL